MVESEKKKVCPPVFLLMGLLMGMIFPAVSAVEGKPVSFPEMSGWKMDGPPQFFSPKTLYEYIDGAADLYLAYEFQDLQVAEYKGKKKAGVTVEVYRHRDPTQAFGIYSQERLAGAKFLELGAQGYYEPNVLNFLIGSYYVKIHGFNTGEDDEKILYPFARKMEETLGGKNSLPAILASFPEEGKKRNSEKFISKNFLGYSYFHSGYTADYEVAGQKFKIFVIEGKDAEDCRRMMERYLAQSGGGEGKASEGAHRVKDPYHGEVDVLWKGRHIWGIVDLKDRNLRSQFLQKLKF